MHLGWTIYSFYLQPYYKAFVFLSFFEEIQQKKKYWILIKSIMTQMMKNSIPWPTIMVVISWYTSNIGVLLMNKYLLSNYGYKFPVFLTMCHMMLCSVFSYVGISVMDIVPLQNVQSKNQLFKICGLSVVFCFSVVCGNMSLNYIPVSFNQAIGATTPFFTAVFAYVVSRKREAWVTYATLLPVVAGVVIASGVNNFQSSISIILRIFVLSYVISFGFELF